MKQPHPGHPLPPDPREAACTSPQGHETAPAVLDVRDLCFSYPERTLFSRWSTRVVPGVTLVRGGDGSGKTSLLRLMSGQLPAGAGELRIQGVSLRDAPEAYRAKVFFTEPRSEAFDALTPGAYLQAQRQRYPSFDTALLERVLAALALEPQMGKQLFMLSTGSKRKVFLAAAFASGADLILLDMPFAALDKASIGGVMALLQDASAHPARAWVVADYTAPEQLDLAGVIDLGD